MIESNPVCDCGAQWGDTHAKGCKLSPKQADPTNPTHYKGHPSGLECIDITQGLSFCEGNAVKYVWRYEGKNGAEDLRKALWYTRKVVGGYTFRNPSCDGPISRWLSWYWASNEHTARDRILRLLLIGEFAAASAMLQQAVIEIQGPG